jgi:hemerythrin
MTHLKLLEKQKQAKSKISKWKEILKIREEINKMETKRTQKSIKQSWFFEEINKIDKLLAKVTKRKREEPN